eukprot:30927-Pelagococcus_subviridis.AAC.12
MGPPVHAFAAGNAAFWNDVYGAAHGSIVEVVHELRHREHSLGRRVGERVFSLEVPDGGARQQRRGGLGARFHGAARHGRLRVARDGLSDYRHRDRAEEEDEDEKHRDELSREVAFFVDADDVFPLQIRRLRGALHVQLPPLELQGLVVAAVHAPVARALAESREHLRAAVGLLVRDERAHAVEPLRELLLDLLVDLLDHLLLPRDPLRLNPQQSALALRGVIRGVDLQRHELIDELRSSLAKPHHLSDVLHDDAVGDDAILLKVFLYVRLLRVLRNVPRLDAVVRQRRDRLVVLADVPVLLRFHPPRVDDKREDRETVQTRDDKHDGLHVDAKHRLVLRRRRGDAGGELRQVLRGAPVHVAVGVVVQI